VLYTITSVPKELEDIAKVLFNSEKMGADAELVVLINDQVIALNIQGSQLDSASVTKETKLLLPEFSQVLDNKFLYKIIGQGVSALLN